MPPRIHIPLEKLVQGQYLYEETLTPISEICRVMNNISRCAFYQRRDEGRWVRRRYSSVIDHSGLPPAPAAGPPNVAPGFVPRPDPVIAPVADPISASPENGQDDTTPSNPATLAVRVYAAMQRQMDTIETIQKTLNPQQDLQSERTVRILAALNRALREIAVITKIDETTFPDAADNDPVPDDLDQFRRELARRIRGLVDAERGGAGESPERPSAPLAG